MSVILNKEATIPTISSDALSIAQALVQGTSNVQTIQSALEAIKTPAAVSSELVADQEPKIDDEEFLNSQEATPEKCLALLEDAVKKGIDFDKKIFFDQIKEKDVSFLPVIQFFFKYCVTDVNSLKDEKYKTLLDDLCEDEITNKWLIRYLIGEGHAYSPKTLYLLCKDNEVEVISILLNKPIEFAKKYVEDFNLKHAVCNFNGIDNSKDLPGDETRSGAKLFSETFENLPENIRKMIPEECLKMTAQAFKDAYSLTLNDKTVDDIKRGKLVIIPAGYAKDAEDEGHDSYLVFGFGYMFFCNRGDRPESVKMLQGYKIDTNAFSLRILKWILQIADKGTEKQAAKYLYKKIPKMLSATTDDFCACLERHLSPKKQQKIGNCPYASAKLAARLAVAMGLFFCREGTNIKKAKHFSKAISAHLRLSALDKYIAFHQANKSLGLYDVELGREAVSLAIKHLKSNPEIDLNDYPRFKKIYEVGRSLAAQAS